MVAALVSRDQGTNGFDQLLAIKLHMALFF